MLLEREKTPMRYFALLLIVATLMVAGTATSRAANRPGPQLCVFAKVQAQEDLHICLAASAAGARAGAPAFPAQCQAEFAAALARIDAAAAQAGTSCRYVDNKDGTVSDLNTGLMWVQTTGVIGGPNTGKVNDVNNTYTWTSGAGAAPDGTVFIQFLGTLNAGHSTDGRMGTPITGCFANHCDWRLPSIVELLSIVTRDTSPSIAPIFGPTQHQPGFYWSATSAPGPAQAWGVFFQGGGWFSDGKTDNRNYARAVRCGAPPCAI